MRQDIASDLVASVHSVLVEEGQQVDAGTELLLLESMKMEIPVIAEAGGTVTEVKVAAGDVVQEGDVLVVVE